MSEVKTKSLFKKPKNKKRIIPKKRKASDDEIDDEPKNTDEQVSSKDKDATSALVGQSDDEGETSTLMKIQQMKKARKIKNQFRSKKQPKPRKHLSNMNADQEEEEQEQILVEANKDLKQRLEGNFAIVGSSTNDGEGNVLSLKHKSAMEQFINSQMEDGKKESPGMASADDTAKQNREIKNTDDLYAEILLQSSEQVKPEKDSKSGEDVGAGGSMLGGTGICEIVLPVEDRIKAAKETELAAAKIERTRSTRGLHYDNTGQNNTQDIEKNTDISQMLPLSFGSGPGKRRNPTTTQSSIPKNKPSTLSNPVNPLSAGRVMNKNISSDIGSSYSHNFRLHNEEWISNKRKQEQVDKVQVVPEEDGDSRVGFEASRGLKPDRGGNSGTRNDQRANDNRAYRTFVKREMKR